MALSVGIPWCTQAFHQVSICVSIAGQYQDPWQYVDDIWLMFNNAWLYNRKTSRVYKYCSKLAEVFEQEIDPVMQSLGYCCGRKVRQNVSLNRLKVMEVMEINC